MFTRNSYREPCYQQTLKQSTAPLLNRVDPIQSAACAPCEKGYGSVASRNRFAPSKKGVTSEQWIGQVTDVESSLLGQNSAIGCGRERVNNAIKAEPLGSTECGPWFNAQDTLITHPREHYREMQVGTKRMFNRERQPVDWLDQRFAIDTRNLAKDSYKRRDPVPLDQRSALPPSQ
jgi:hypothetical protein